jgi:conjugal transfer mating pair stabilization protein TraG
MSLNIYTTGSAEFLEIMLNASAMITSSGTSEDLARIGLMLGLLYLGFQAVWNAQGISFHKAGLLLVLYLIFYGPTTTAVIEDTTSGQVRVVDNVPVGPTFIGSVISTIAYEITRVSEQAFSTPTMTDYGLFSSLTTISRVRDALRNPMSLDSYVNYRKNEGWNLPKSVDEFITFCTLNPIALREYQDIDQLYRASGVEGVLNAPMTSQYVFIHDGVEAGGRLISCSQAQSIITNALQAVYTDLLDDILAKGFAAEKAAGKMTNGVDVAARTDAAIQSMAMSAKNAQSYTTMALIVPVFGDARVNALNHWQEQNAAMALRESLNQQEVQWAGKGDIFKHYMRPMIAFFEGLLYAMTPFMAFALVLGGAGLSILGKYMMLPLAVGLWMPLLSIVNAFTLWYAGAEAQSVFDAYDPAGQGFAMLQVLDLDQAVSKALGIGGLLAASVPPLALFIVSGSAMVANGIMSQMTAGEKFKSEDVLPRAKNQAPVMDTTSGFTADQLTVGPSVTGAREAGPQISASQAAQAMVQSAENASISATKTMQENLRTATTQLASTASGRQALAQLGNQMASNLNLGQNAEYGAAVNALKAKGFSQDDIAAGSYASALNPGVPGLASATLGQSQEFKQMSKDEQRAASEQMAKIASIVQNTLSNQSSYSASDAFTQSSQAMDQVSNSQEISSSVANAKTAQQVYAEASTKQEGWAASQNLDLGLAAQKSANNSGQTKAEAADGIHNLAGKTADDRAAIRALMKSDAVQNVSTDNDMRVIAASTLHMMNTGRLGELVTSEYNPFDFSVSAGDAQRNHGIEGDVASSTAGSDGIEGRFNAARANANAAYEETSAMNQDGYTNAKDFGADTVRSEYATGQAKPRETFDHESSRIVSTNEIPKVNNDMVDSTRPVKDRAKLIGSLFD